MPDLAPGDAVHLVQAAAVVSCFFALSHVGVYREVPHRFHAYSYIQALVEQLIEQSGANQLRGCCGHIAKVVVIKIKPNSRGWLKAHTQVTTADAGSRPDSAGGQAAWIVDNQRVVDRDCAVVGKRIFEKQIRPVEPPM